MQDPLGRLDGPEKKTAGSGAAPGGLEFLGSTGLLDPASLQCLSLHWPSIEKQKGEE
jgi:hypothetical protein